MKYSDNVMCTILLSSYLGIKDDSVKPLSLGEWNRFVELLIQNNLEPSIVYSDDVSQLKNIGYEEAFIERLKALVDRGVGVAFELDEYERRGIGVVTFLDKEYPIMLRRKLNNKKPPVLFYAGNLELANKVGIGVVGARDVSEKGTEFTKKLVEKAVDERLVIYSGGAKGVDITSQSIALNAEGAVVAYLAEALTDRIKKKDIIQNLSAGRLLLFSDQKPDMGFSAGRAMNRNKFIYASAIGTFVVEADYNKGGTWNGAIEALKNNWGEVFVWDKDMEGNRKLIEAGGISYKLSEGKLIDIINAAKGKCTSRLSGEFKQMSIFDMQG